MAIVPTDAEIKLQNILIGLTEKNKILDNYKHNVVLIIGLLNRLKDELNNLNEELKEIPRRDMAPDQKDALINEKVREIKRLNEIIDKISVELGNYNISKNDSTYLKNIIQDYINKYSNHGPPDERLNINFDIAPEDILEGGRRRRHRKSKKQKKSRRRRSTMKHGGWVLKGSKY